MKKTTRRSWVWSYRQSVYNNLTMPEFRAKLLGLMGLSSGTYIGFKFPEQR